MSPKTLLIDVFETVVDWKSGIIRDLAEHFEGSLAVIGRRQWPISGVRNINRRRSSFEKSHDFVDLATLHRENLRRICHQHSFPLGSTNSEGWIVQASHRLHYWPVSRKGINSLKKNLSGHSIPTVISL